MVVQKQVIVGGPRYVERGRVASPSSTDLYNCPSVFIGVKSGRRGLLQRTSHCCSHGGVLRVTDKVKMTPRLRLGFGYLQAFKL